MLCSIVNVSIFGGSTPLSGGQRKSLLVLSQSEWVGQLVGGGSGVSKSSQSPLLILAISIIVSEENHNLMNKSPFADTNNVTKIF